MIAAKDGGNWSITNFGKPQGFTGIDFDLNSGLVTRDNEFWAGVETQMLTVMDEPSTDAIVPTTYITGLSILDSKLSTSDRKFTESQLKKIDTLWKVDAAIRYESKEAALSERFPQTELRWDSVESTYFLPINFQLPYNQNYFTFYYAGTDYNDTLPDRDRYNLSLQNRR